MVYLIHFDRPINPGHPARHYLGSAADLSARLAAHAAGSRRAARLTQVAKKRGITWQVVRLWCGGRAIERQLKAHKNAPLYCPICHPDSYRSGPAPAPPPGSYYPRPEINVPV